LVKFLFSDKGTKIKIIKKKEKIVGVKHTYY
jgi:hypothetical protein